MNISSPISVLAANAGNASSSNSCPPSDPDSGRTVLGILWTCLSVLFACTWVSVHPNVPGPNEGSTVNRLWAKTKLMIIALIAPELVLMWAVRQWYAARELTKGVCVVCGEDASILCAFEFDHQVYRGWTKTHAFFALMGGFALYEGDNHVTVLRFVPARLQDQPVEEYEEAKQEILDAFKPHPSIVTHSSINMTFGGLPSDHAAIPSSDTTNTKHDVYRRSFAAHETFISRVTEEEIEDRNKSNGFAKFIVVGQTTWFIVQLCARWATGLPVTELEIMTLAFAAMNVPIYFFWWNKPLEVGVPIRINTNRDTQTIKENTDDQPQVDGQRAGLVTVLYRRLILGTLPKNERASTERKGDELGFGPLSKIFIILLVGPLCLIVLPTQAVFDIFDPRPDVNVKLDPRIEVGNSRPEKVESFERTHDLEPSYAADTSIAFGAAVIFGAIHCIAWISQFPSDQEKTLWRVCSLLVACIPIYMAFVNLRKSLDPEKKAWWIMWLGFLYIIAILAYIFARLCLLLQGFLALRALPPAALEAVQWPNFLPHI
ncbi:hypothetical protein D9757_010367 [Collybiopsis confluens]|uniref:Uncharacterized protein n=1 Tax=Collybiopsis confluens TaxID=2823264 RepID=A0A8H5GUL8_9AGAR|nr:hypothetical protein D9757_010367 [Collybiopsis confluens]